MSLTLTGVGGTSIERALDSYLFIDGAYPARALREADAFVGGAPLPGLTAHEFSTTLPTKNGVSNLYSPIGAEYSVRARGRAVRSSTHPKSKAA